MKTIKFLALALGILLSPGQVFSQQNGVEEIAPASVAAALTEGAIFVDVREPNEVEVFAFDLPGVINLPLSELPDRLAELPRDQHLVLACKVGIRSMKAAALLTENNFTRLYSLAGGIVGWEAAGFPVKKTDRSKMPGPLNIKQCCSAKSTGEKGGKSCCADKAGTESAKTSCGDKGKAKGKFCCAGGSR